MEQKRCYGCMHPKGDLPFCENCGFDERSTNASHQLAMGTVLRDQYVIGRVLGQGGFGITYLGWDRYLDTPVAIKEYYPGGVVQRESGRSDTVEICTSGEDTRFQNNLSRFLQEAKALAKFRNIPEIVHVHNIFRENGTAYIVMEYVEGITLKEYVRRKGGRLGAQELFAILRPVLEALDTVHQAGIVHRDISPDNIMLLPSGGAKLLDFGAAKEVENPDTNREPVRSTEAILKHGFAPMEQYQRKGALGPWTDVYAICATIYYCLTGRVPEDAPQRMMEDINPDWDAIADLSPRQRQILEQGMHLRARERPDSVAALCSALFGEEQPQKPPLFEKAAAAPGDVRASGTVALQRDAQIVTAPVTPAEPVLTAPVERVAPAGNHTAPIRPEPSQPEKAPGRKKRIIPVLAAVLALAVVLCGGFFALQSMDLFGSDDSSSESRLDRSEREDSAETTEDFSRMESPGAEAPAADAPAADAPAADAPVADSPVEVEEVELMVWCSRDELECTTQMVEAFVVAHPEYDCSITVAAVEAYDSAAKLLKDPGSCPDLFATNAGSISDLVDAGLLLPITVDAEHLASQFGAGAVDAVTRYNDALDRELLYGIPYYPNTWFLFYNNTMYTEEDVKSLERMMAKDLGAGVRNFSCEIGNSWYIEAFFHAAGCSVFGPDGEDPTRCDWNSPNGLAAAEYICDLAGNPRYYDNTGGAEAVQMMKEGRLGAMCTGSWYYSELYAALGDDLSACALPTIQVGGRECRLTPFADYMSYCVSSFTAHPLAAQQLAAWLCSADSQLIRYQTVGTMPCAMELLEQDAITANAAAVGLMEQTAYTVLQPAIPKMADYWGPAENLGKGIIDGLITPANLQNQLNKFVDAFIG